MFKAFCDRANAGLPCNAKKCDHISSDIREWLYSTFSHVWVYNSNLIILSGLLPLLDISPLDVSSSPVPASSATNPYPWDGFEVDPAVHVTVTNVQKAIYKEAIKDGNIFIADCPNTMFMWAHVLLGEKANYAEPCILEARMLSGVLRWTCAWADAVKTHYTSLAVTEHLDLLDF